MKSNMLNYIDLFSGCGGLALGMKKSGWELIFAVEKNEDAFSTFKCNILDSDETISAWPNWLPRTPIDLNCLLDDYQDKLSGFKGNIQLVAGGPPCQGFSSAGLRNEKDARNKLVVSYLKFIDLVEPLNVFFENVQGITQPFAIPGEVNEKINYSDYLNEELTHRGYSVQSKMIDFSVYGVPQKRKRFILFASKNVQADAFFKSLNNIREKFLTENNISIPVSVFDAISDLNQSYGTYNSDITPNFKFGVYGEAKSAYQKYCRKDIHENEMPDSHRFPNHRIKTTDRFQELRDLKICGRNLAKILFEEYQCKKNCFRILNISLPSPTLTTNPDDYLHYCENRILTVREYARIQSFPDWFTFKGKYTTGGKRRKTDVPRYSQVGNAIPPLFAEQVGLAIKELVTLEVERLNKK